jgi:CDGSH-type Zn-finger protein
MTEPGGTSHKASQFKVKVLKDGPYIVSGGAPLAEQIMCVDGEGQTHGWRQGREYPAQETYAICRCGRSHNSPFCDGTHTKVHFDGTEVATHAPYSEQASEITGPGLKLTDAEAFCANGRFCHRAGGAWQLTQQSDDPRARETAIEEACDCPSGRLVAWDVNGTAIEPDLEPSIGLVQDIQAGRMGPMWVRGGIPIESADGTLYETRNRVTLCRCGKSANKPFCDGSHLN